MYWPDWRPDDAGAVNGRRCIRVIASMFLQVDQLCHQEAVAAVMNAVTEAMVEKRVDTQGYVMTVGDLIRTLAVEATAHHLRHDREPARCATALERRAPQMR